MSEEIKSCLLGTAIGDSFGLPFEGISKKRLSKFIKKPLNEYHFLFNKGMISDDTEHTCITALAIIESDLNKDIFIKKLSNNFRLWFLLLPAGIGFATLKSLFKLCIGFSYKKRGVYSAGNGPAMRSSILGVCFGNDINKLKEYIYLSTIITHTDPKAYHGALLVAYSAYLSSKHEYISPDIFFNQIKDIIEDDELISIIKKVCESIKNGNKTSDFLKEINCENGVSGYMYHTVPAVIHSWLIYQNDLLGGLNDILRCGGDTDTTCAILGGIISPNTGLKNIPKTITDNIFEIQYSKDFIEKLGDNLSNILNNKKLEHNLKISIPKILIRNIFFLIIVLSHGFRRLLPPY